MALPPLTDEGELPAGVHQTSLSEVRALFGVGSARRQTLILRLERIYRAARATGHLMRFVVFGSFVTRKPEPQDVDLFLVMADEFDASQLSGDMRLLSITVPRRLVSARACCGSAVKRGGQTSEPR